MRPHTRPAGQGQGFRSEHPVSKDVPSEMAKGRGQVGDGFRDQVGLAASRKASARSVIFPLSREGVAPREPDVGKRSRDGFPLHSTRVLERSLDPPSNRGQGRAASVRESSEEDKEEEGGSR